MAGGASMSQAEGAEPVIEHRQPPSSIPSTKLAAPGEMSLAEELQLQAAAATRAVPRKHARGAALRSRKWLLHRLLVLADVAGLTSAFALTEFLAARTATHGHVGIDAEGLLFVLTLPA